MKKIWLWMAAAICMMVLPGIARAQVLLIANPSVKATGVSKGEIRDVFTGNATSLHDGSKVIPVLLKSGETTNAFLAAFIGKSDAAFRASWRSLVFSGQGSMPKQEDTDAAMVEYVLHTSGAVGYVGKSAAHDGVKVLQVR